MTTREVVEELLRRIAGGDPDEIARSYAANVDWQLDWPAERHGGDIPWIRHRVGRADVADHFRSIAENHDPAEAAVTVHHILVDGPDAVVMATLDNTLQHNGARYRAHVALHLTVENGEVTRHHVYEDSLSVAEAWAATD